MSPNDQFETTEYTKALKFQPWGVTLTYSRTSTKTKTRSVHFLKVQIASTTLSIDVQSSKTQPRAAMENIHTQREATKRTARNKNLIKSETLHQRNSSSLGWRSTCTNQAELRNEPRSNRNHHPPHISKPIHHLVQLIVLNQNCNNLLTNLANSKPFH